MALNGTPWHFERLTVQVDGIGEAVSHKSLDWDFEIGGEQATDRLGNPRGTIRGIYKGTAKIELATQEAMTMLEAQADAAADEVTMTFNYAPLEGPGGEITLFLRLNKGAGTEQKEEESMFTLEFEHTDVAQVNGNPIRPLEEQSAAA